MIRNGEVQKILDFLADGKCENNADWKYRFKENSDKMRTGSLLDVAIVLKGLLLLAQTKPLSFREKKMLERTRYLLVSELAMAKNWEETEIEDLLNRALSKCKLRFPEASSWKLASRSLDVARATHTSHKMQRSGRTLSSIGKPMPGTLHIFRLEPIRCNTRSTTTSAPNPRCRSSTPRAR